MYLESDYPWLYFAMAGIFAFALGIFGTVFTTQSQMYEAKDNENIRIFVVAEMTKKEHGNSLKNEKAENVFTKPV